MSRDVGTTRSDSETNPVDPGTISRNERATSLDLVTTPEKFVTTPLKSGATWRDSAAM
jgi:hypothetical protein